jgi:hypothetical protein
MNIWGEGHPFGGAGEHYLPKEYERCFCWVFNLLELMEMMCSAEEENMLNNLEVMYLVDCHEESMYQELVKWSIRLYVQRRVCMDSWEGVCRRALQQDREKGGHGER